MFILKQFDFSSIFKKNPLLKAFLFQLIDVGDSAGSLISEAIGLLRTFQRLSAARTFMAKLSGDCMKMFDWAVKIFEKISNSVISFPKFTSYDLFVVSCIAFPMTIINFISSALTRSKFPCYLFTYALFFLIGLGVAYYEFSISILMVCFAPSIVILPISILFGRDMFCKGIDLSCLDCECMKKIPCKCFRRKTSNMNEDPDSDSDIDEDFECFCFIVDNRVPFTYSIIPCFILFTASMIPVLSNRYSLLVAYLILASLIILITFIAELIDRYNSKNFCEHYGKVTTKIIEFFINLFPLFIIPSTQSFVEIWRGRYEYTWCVLIAYLGFSLLLPFALTYIMIYNKAPDITEKYKESKWEKINIYCCFALFDLMKQVVYSICAAFDVPWGCIGTEIAWFIIICLVRPYKNKSDFFI